MKSYLKCMEGDSEQHLYDEGSTFGRGVRLYQFDNGLRRIVSRALQDVEVALRAKVVQVFSMRYGPYWFTDSSLFKNQQFFGGSLVSLQKEVSRSKEEFIKDFSKKWDSPELPPAWKTMEVASFGTLSKMLENFKDAELKKVVAREFGLPQYGYLESWVRCAVVLRNFCAHHARIWNRRFPLKPKLPGYLPNPWISDQTKPQKLYHQLCYLMYLEQAVLQDFDLKSELFQLLDLFGDIDCHAMGFPEDWRDEDLWK